MKELLNKLEFDLIIIKSDLKKIQDKIYELECLIRYIKNENNSRSNFRDDRKRKDR